MPNFKFLNIAPYCRLLYSSARYLHYKPDSIVVAAAARTPWGKYQGQLASVGALQLGQIAVEAAVKQSAIPLEHIKEIFMNEKPQLCHETQKDFIFSNFIKKSKYHSITTNDGDEPSMDSLLKALDALKSQPNSAVVVGGLESATQHENIINKSHQIITHNDLFPEVSSEVIENYINKSLVRYLKSQTEGVFDEEIIPLAVQQQTEKRRIIREITQDELFPENYRDDNRTFQFSDGSAALVLTTGSKVQDLNIAPLAVISGFEYVQNSANILSRSRTCVEQLLGDTALDPLLIKHWEIEDSIPQLVVYLKHHFNLNWDFINPNGGSLIMGHSSAASLLRLITHLTHALSPFEYGCVVSSNSQESLALILQKLPSFSTPERLPLITLYTKDPCPLCDILVEELEQNFPGEYELEKVFIDTKENLRFLRLYRLDIPVVFLNNQFLCMHRLNHRLLRKKLDLLKI